ncbi:hypothetical protein VL06_18165 [Rossellomorea marisflavi]|nr:hypothetical protein VL06_18165 [Rossellomorea marisflavi]KML34743.1 hypothetical protein VL12_03280 [Rossellomorea marisflavi]
MWPRRLAGEAHGLSAESQVLRHKEPILIVFVMKWSLFSFGHNLFLQTKKASGTLMGSPEGFIFCA